MKSGITKIIFIVLLLFLFSYLLQYDYTILGKIEKDGKNTYVANTAYTTEVLQLDQVKLWVSYLQAEKYEDAFAMLTQSCKKSNYGNNLDTFTDTVKKKYFNPAKEKKDIFYTKVKEETNKNSVKTIFSVSIYIDEYKDVVQFLDQKDEYIQNHIVPIGVVETAPFQFQLDVKL